MYRFSADSLVLDRGQSVSLSNNNSNECKVNTNIGIHINGFINVTLSNNNFIVRDYDSYNSQLVGSKIKNVDTYWASSNIDNLFTNCEPSFFLDHFGFEKGLYISGPDTLYQGQIGYFIIKRFGDYLPSINNFRWTILDWSGVWIDNSNNIVLEINTNDSRFKKNLRLQFHEEGSGDRWRNKYIQYINAIPKSKIDTLVNSTGKDMPALFQNYPNPFNSQSSINYYLPNKEFVSLKLYNALGQEVKTLVYENKEAGSHSIKIDLIDFCSGIYFCRLSTTNYSFTKKIILVK